MDNEKKYKEALERARDYYKANLKLDKEDENLILEDIFPELKESEDEKIRKALIDGFTVMKESKNCGKTFSNHNIPVVDILAWLEKQGESKSKCMPSLISLQTSILNTTTMNIDCVSGGMVLTNGTTMQRLRK